jgi:hypothetical protein
MAHRRGGSFVCSAVKHAGGVMHCKYVPQAYRTAPVWACPDGHAHALLTIWYTQSPRIWRLFDSIRLVCARSAGDLLHDAREWQVSGGAAGGSLGRCGFGSNTHRASPFCFIVLLWGKPLHTFPGGTPRALAKALAKGLDSARGYANVGHFCPASQLRELLGLRDRRGRWELLQS